MGTSAATITCPYCNGVVERSEGACPHCHGDLNAPAFRKMLVDIDARTSGILANVSQIGDSAEDTRKRIEKLEELNKQRVASDTKPDGAVPQVNMLRLVRGLISGDWKDAEFERKVAADSADVARTMGMAAVSTGGALVPTQYLAAAFIDSLKARSVVEGLGATILDGLVGSPVEIARLAQSTTAEWVDENAEKPEKDLAFEKLSMVPHECAAFSRVSNRLVMLSNPGILNLLQNDLSRAIAGAFDIAAIRGSGLLSEPRGVTNTVGINTHVLAADVGNGAIPTLDDCYDILYSIEADDADVGKLGWVFNPRTFNTLRKIRDASGGAGTGQYMLQPDVTAPFKGTMLGMPFRTTTRIPINLTKGGSVNCSEIIFGNWEDLLLARWGVLEIRASQDAGTAFRYNQTWIRASLLGDVGVRHPVSFCLANGVRP